MKIPNTVSLAIAKSRQFQQNQSWFQYWSESPNTAHLCNLHPTIIPLRTGDRAVSTNFNPILEPAHLGINSAFLVVFVFLYNCGLFWGCFPTHRVIFRWELAAFLHFLSNFLGWFSGTFSILPCYFGSRMRVACRAVELKPLSNLCAHDFWGARLRPRQVELGAGQKISCLKNILISNIFNLIFNR